MTLEEALSQRVTAIPAVSAAAGSRIGWGRRLAAVPAVTMLIVSDPRPQTFGGLQQVRPTIVQMDVWAGVHAVGVAMREALIDGLLPPALVGAVRFQRGQVSNVRSTAPQEGGASNPRMQAELYRESIDFIFFHDA